MLGKALNPYDPTGIAEVGADSEETQSDGTIYNLQGARLSSVPRDGIYIVNKRKYVR